jgi:hypothetical protein
MSEKRNDDQQLCRQILSFFFPARCPLESIQPLLTNPRSPSFSGMENLICYLLEQFCSPSQQPCLFWFSLHNQPRVKPKDHNTSENKRVRHPLILKTSIIAQSPDNPKNCCNPNSNKFLFLFPKDSLFI